MHLINHHVLCESTPAEIRAAIELLQIELFAAESTSLDDP